MPFAAIGLTVGALACFLLSELPPAWFSLVLLVGAAVAWRCPRWRVIGFIALGFALAWVAAEQRRQAWLPTALEGRTLIVEGRVLSLPSQASTRFDFQIDAQADAANCPACGRVRLGWQDAPALRLGQRWRFAVRLKAPRGLSNPGIFDYERWLFERGYVATGYVRERDQKPAWLASATGVTAWRQVVLDRIGAALHGQGMHAVIAALATGERAAMTDSQWAVFRATGTGHLVAISGLHVGLVAGLVFLLVRRFSGPWNLWIPTPRLAAMLALGAAIFYAALAGFSLPTQRAVIMLSAAFLGPLLGRAVAPHHGLSLALLLVVMMQPIAVLAPGFWLSFGAVGVILFIASGRAGGPRWWRWGRTHLWIAFGLAPLSLYWFAQTSLVAPLANLVAVPWVSVFVVPLVILGALPGLLPGSANTAMSDWLLREAEAMLAGLWPLLEWLGQWSWASWQPASGGGLALAALALAFALIAAPRGWPGRWLAMPVLLPVFWPTANPTPPLGGFELTVLDVGQGLSALVRTAHHNLLYDTGPSYPTGFDTGERIVAPYLRSRAIERLDLVLVSHGDNDHRGGLEAVRDGVTVERVISGEPDRVPGAEPCHAGMNWEWDAVRFRVIGPKPGHAKRGNDASCVLRIETADDALILTADLESSGEEELLQDEIANLPAGVLQIPHHGSASSSRPAFVSAVRPRIGIVTAGYRNVFGLPRDDILQRYRAFGTEIRDTRFDGALRLNFPPDGRAKVVHAQRIDGRKVWTPE